MFPDEGDHAGQHEGAGPAGGQLFTDYNYIENSCIYGLFLFIVQTKTAKGHAVRKMDDPRDL